VVWASSSFPGSILFIGFLLWMKLPSELALET